MGPGIYGNVLDKIRKQIEYCGLIDNYNVSEKSMNHIIHIINNDPGILPIDKAQLIDYIGEVRRDNRNNSIDKILE